MGLSAVRWVANSPRCTRSRRRADIPDWASHLALLSELGLRAHGPRKQVLEAAEFSAPTSASLILPSRLPPASGVTSGKRISPDGVTPDRQNP